MVTLNMPLPEEPSLDHSPTPVQIAEFSHFLNLGLLDLAQVPPEAVSIYLDTIREGFSRAFQGWLDSVATTPDDRCIVLKGLDPEKILKESAMRLGVSKGLHRFLLKEAGHTLLQVLIAQQLELEAVNR